LSGEVHETHGLAALIARHDARPAKLRGDPFGNSPRIKGI
jgi:hypothetical protein